MKLTAQRQAVQPRAALTDISNHLDTTAPRVGCSGVLCRGRTPITCHGQRPIAIDADLL